MKNKSGRGSITKAFNRIKRYYNDREYRLKRLESHKKYYQNPEVKIKAREDYKNRKKILNEFTHKRCKKCGKFLNYTTKSGFCRKHHKKRGKKKNGKK